MFKKLAKLLKKLLSKRSYYRDAKGRFTKND